jgi:hypothetical protein
MIPLTMKLKGVDIIGYTLDIRYNKIYFFDNQKKIVSKDKFYKNQLLIQKLDKHIKKKYGDK